MSFDSRTHARSAPEIVVPEGTLEVSSSDPKIISENDALSPVNALVCAPVWRRGLASIVDEFGICILTNVPTIITLYGLLYALRSGAFPTFRRDIELLFTPSDNVSATILVLLYFGIAALVSPAIRLIYYATFESSSSQASPGKLLFGLKVVDVQGNRFGFWRSLGKACIQSALFACCVLGPWALSMFLSKTGSGDSALALGLAGVVVYMLICYGVIAFNDERQTLLDKLMRRFVIHEKAAPGAATSISRNAMHIGFWAVLATGLIGYAGLHLLHSDKLMSEFSPMIRPNYSGFAVVAKKSVLPGTVVFPEDFELVKTGRFITPISTVADLSQMQGALVLGPITEKGMVHQYEIATKHLKVSSVSQRDLTADEYYAYRMKKLHAYMRGLKKTGGGWEKAYATRAWIRNEHGDYEGALADCLLAIKKSKGNLGDLSNDVNLNLARAYSGLGDFKNAGMALANIEVEEDMRDAAFYAVRAQIYRHDGKRKLAEADDLRAASLRRDAQAVELSNAAGRNKWRSDDKQISLMLWNEALNISALPEIYRERAQFYIDNADLQNALKDATAAVDRSGGTSWDWRESCNLRADIYEKLGDNRSAEQDRARAEQSTGSAN